MSKESPIVIKNNRGTKAKKRIEKLLRQVLIEIGERREEDKIPDDLNYNIIIV
jgi:hypothetical protein